ncbi:unnamed protein product [Malus baccata var. baccata]
MKFRLRGVVIYIHIRDESRIESTSQIIHCIFLQPKNRINPSHISIKIKVNQRRKTYTPCLCMYIGLCT